MEKVAWLMILSAYQLTSCTKDTPWLLTPDPYALDRLDGSVQRRNVPSSEIGSGTDATEYCPREECSGFVWEETQVGMTVVGRCIGGTSNAERRCSKDPVDGSTRWEAVDCDVDQERMKIIDEVVALPPEVSAQKWRVITANSSLPPQPLLDIYFLQQIYEALQNSSTKYATERLIESVLGIASNMLMNNYREMSVDRISEMDRLTAGSTLLQVLDDFALNLVNSTDIVSVILENVGMEVRMFKPDSAPMNRNMMVLQQNESSITLYAELFQSIKQSSFDQIRIGAYYYSNMSFYLPESRDASNETLVSPIISATLHCDDSPCPVFLNTSAVEIVFKHPVQLVGHLGATNTTTTCVYWKFSESNITDSFSSGEWTDVNCSKIYRKSNATYTVCECTHLTHFTLLLSPAISDTEGFTLRIAVYICVAISLVGMLLTCAVIIFIRSLWNMRNYVHVNLCASLFIAQLIFILGVGRTTNTVGCQVVAVLLHYFFLVSFMWMLMEGVVIYVSLVSVFIKHKKRYIAAFTIASYGLPLLYMGLCIPLGFLLWKDGRVGYGYDEACWLRYDTHFILTFIVPVALIFLINIILLVTVIAIACNHYHRDVHKSQLSSAKHWIKVTILLLVIMGTAWILGVLVFDFSGTVILVYIYSVITAVQSKTSSTLSVLPAEAIATTQREGFFIFLVFMPFSKQVRTAARRWWRTTMSESEFFGKYFEQQCVSSRRNTASSADPPNDSKSDKSKQNDEATVIVNAQAPLQNSNNHVSRQYRLRTTPSDVSLRQMIRIAELDFSIEEEEEFVTPL